MCSTTDRLRDAVPSPTMPHRKRIWVCLKKLGESLNFDHFHAEKKPSGNDKNTVCELENGPVEIVDLSIKNGGFPYFFCRFTRPGSRKKNSSRYRKKSSPFYPTFFSRLGRCIQKIRYKRSKMEFPCSLPQRNTPGRSGCAIVITVAKNH